MMMKDRAVIFVRQQSADDPYGVSFRRIDLRDVMVFEKQAVGAESRDESRCVIYYFPKRSKAAGKRAISADDGGFPHIHPGDYCVTGVCKRGYSPLTDEMGLCRRIVSVEKRDCGSERVHHIVIEAV